MNLNAEEMRVRELLERAVDEVTPPPGGGSEKIFAQASRVRWRRRAAVTGLAVAAVAVGAVLGPVALAEHDGRESVAIAPAAVGKQTAKSKRLAELLPRDIGTVRQYFGPANAKQPSKPVPPLPGSGPLDGTYTVSRDGGTGVLTVAVRDSAAFRVVEEKGDLCVQDAQGRQQNPDCTIEKLPNGRTLVFWPGGKGFGSPSWSGIRLMGLLILDAGRTLEVYTQTRVPGPGDARPLKTVPLTPSQLRDLLLRPELLQR